MEDSHQTPPTAREVAVRTIALKYVVTRAHTQVPRAVFKDRLRAKTERERSQLKVEAKRERDAFWDAVSPIQDHFSPWETKFLRTTSFSMTAQQQVNASWRIEAFQVLLWALGRLKKIPPYDSTAAHKLIETYPPSNFLTTASLRAEEELEQEREDAELWHWRSRTRQLIEEARPFPNALKVAEMNSYDDIVRSIARNPSSNRRIKFVNEDFRAFGKPYRDLSDEEWSDVRSITMERHFALNWLCGYAPGNRWDDTPTDT